VNCAWFINLGGGRITARHWVMTLIVDKASTLPKDLATSH